VNGISQDLGQLWVNNVHGNLAQDQLSAQGEGSLKYMPSEKPIYEMFLLDCIYNDNFTGNCPYS